MSRCGAEWQHRGHQETAQRELGYGPFHQLFSRDFAAALRTTAGLPRKGAPPRGLKAADMGRRRQEWNGSVVAARPWTRAERRVVLRGFIGRFSIAIEPLIVAVFFALLPVGMLLRQREIALLSAPIFAFAAIAFLAYAIALIVPSARAVFETFAPIYTVDGYIRYRVTQKAQPEYYVAVLSDDQQTLGEWPLREWPASIGKRALWPVLAEFSRYGGIHKIDGRSTGVLPNDISPFGVGIALDEERRASRLR
jgi:hypothetical protein